MARTLATRLKLAAAAANAGCKLLQVQIAFHSSTVPISPSQDKGPLAPDQPHCLRHVLHLAEAVQVVSVVVRDATVMRGHHGHALRMRRQGIASIEMGSVWSCPNIACAISAVRTAASSSLLRG